MSNRSAATVRSATISANTSSGVSDPALEKRGSESRVNTTTSGSQEYPTVAMNSSGNYVVTWDNNNQIFAQRV